MQSFAKSKMRDQYQSANIADFDAIPERESIEFSADRPLQGIRMRLLASPSP
jgi:hypothetical protein